jgi:hypothetical protein
LHGVLGFLLRYWDNGISQASKVYNGGESLGDVFRRGGIVDVDVATLS